MISHDLECVFVHIPKTGGTSILHYFLDVSGITWENRADLLLGFNDVPAHGPQRLTHLTMSEYLALGYLSRRQCERYFKFAFVRNPWSRLLSEYLFRYLGVYTFREFVMDYVPCNMPGQYPQKGKKGKSEADSFLDQKRHLLPQYKFIFDDEGRQCVDFIARYENLDENFSSIVRKLGVEGKSVLQRKNTAQDHLKNALVQKGILQPDESIKFNGEIDYRNFYSEETKSAVANYYHKDISLFEYQF
ncbi:chondroitin 4-O-sulfotransferase [Oleiphilus messinensis]|uniref:Chondroitin 4-O-sulfotransferase n=1 Tax=Oleiphilus messinensis TaxID=141451 RepID=A0A1Y0IB02_9GAMM|nr:sulfotransferase family 2 domain-containing protein [Oleiphilus messinensis]ARU57712.1 chondroitin 4-O-sulfotransferase [Oleiphilus messinensis]